RSSDLPPTLGSEPRELLSEGISVGVVLTEGHAHSFLLVDGVGDAVDLHVEPGAEHVLVERHPQPFVTERRRPALTLSLVTVGGGVDDFSGLALELDRTVEVEVPVEAIVVVAESDEEGDDEATIPTYVDGSGELDGALEQDARILLADADGIRDRVRMPQIIGEHRVRVVDLTEAVAAELERVRVFAHRVLAGIEVVLPEAHRARIAVRHDHLRHRGPVDDGTPLALVIEADLVEYKPPDPNEPESDLPLLPIENVTVEREAPALWLRDLDRLLRGPRFGQPGVEVVVETLLGHRHDVGVDDLDDLTGVEVEVGDEPLERVGPGIVLRVRLDERRTAHEASAGLTGNVEASGRERADADRFDIGDAASLDRSPPGGIVADHLLGFFVLGHRDGRLALGGDVEDAGEKDLALGQ